MPAACETLCADKADARIEKHVELLDTHLEETREEEMPELVNDHEEAEGV